MPLKETTEIIGRVGQLIENVESEAYAAGHKKGRAEAEQEAEDHFQNYPEDYPRAQLQKYAFAIELLKSIELTDPLLGCGYLSTEIKALERERCTYMI